MTKDYYGTPKNEGAGGVNDWLTPPALVKLLGPFDLDPCGCAQQPGWLAESVKKVYCPPQDGLALPWRGRVWCNPPYGANVGAWAAKLAQHGRGLLLIFARTETSAWQDTVWPTGSAFLFMKGRISFFYPSGQRSRGSGVGSVLVAYGAQDIQCLETCGLRGTLLIRGRAVGSQLVNKL